MTSNDKTERKTDTKEIVAILDAGAQYGKLIDRRVRELNIESVLIPFDTSANELKQYSAIIISGGPSSVYAKDAPKYDPLLFKLNIPILAICYGFQLMIHVFNGEIKRGQEREDGQFTISIDNKSKLFSNINSKQTSVLLTHGDIVSKMPINSGFKTIGKSCLNNIIVAGENSKLNIYGVQFHPEVDLTPCGKQIFSNFLYNICKLSANYTLKNRMQTAIEYIQNKVGKNKKCLCLVSGGVDSSVCCALLQKALSTNNTNDNLNGLDSEYINILNIASDCYNLLKPQQIYPLHIDHGFMRYNESKTVINALKSIGINVHLCNAQTYFSNGKTIINNKFETNKLCNTIKPEYKRKIIGDLFMKLCDKVVKQDTFFGDKLIFDDMLLVQGTLRPDLIESASNIANKGGTADVIKTHHNDTELVRQLRAKGKVIEPLTDYHKDEVRIIGQKLGLPTELIWRQPFPGPGLAIRIICTNGKPYCTQNDNIIIEKLNNITNKAAQNNIYGCLMGFQTVGVQGDGRTYAHCIGLTCDNNNTTNIPWNDLYNMAKNIPTQILNVNRVVFIYGNILKGKQQNVTETYLKINVIQQLRKCDKIVNDILFKYNLINKISQVPVILFPSNFGCNDKNARSICIRTFITNDFMTGVPARINKDIKEEIIFEMFEEILKVDGIQRVAFDLTPKPPGTTEWE